MSAAPARAGRLAGRVALVTGAASGIGRAIALRFAGEGARVALNDLPGNPGLAAAAAECAAAAAPGAPPLTAPADVGDEAAIAAMVRQVVAEAGRLDILVNSAAFQLKSPSHQASAADFDAVLRVGLRGVFLCCREALGHFLARPGGGTIVTISSVHQIVPKPGYLSYAMAKSALANMTQTLALEYAGQGIRVNAIGPGAIATPMNAAWKDDPVLRRAVERRIPMRRAGEPEEIAAVAAFLASDEASYVTGQTLYACGGLTLHAEFAEDWATQGG
ncbi:MAG: SDR family oxidoreductase [Dongiaceae bacterium]